MTNREKERAAAQFADFWKDKGYEKGESQVFWLSLLSDVLGVKDAKSFISFENQVMLDHTSFIDGFIDSTHVMIEQKGLGKDLLKPIKQSDGSLLTPFQQAKRYAAELPYSKRPRWIVTCNFAKFLVYDMEKPGGEPEKILLADLEKEYYRLRFLVDEGNEHIKKEMEISLQAGELVGVLYDELLKMYKEPENPLTLQSLNKLCVRLVFCLYAEDAGVFGGKSMFRDYLAEIPASGIRRALNDLFKVLDQSPDQRDKYLADDNPRLAAFPYVNGGLFSEENIEIPPFTEELKELLLGRASDDFDWSEISPTIFGAVFESTLNPETRRSGGMHYTSIENIHKVIDPLFLDSLKKELAEIKNISVQRTKRAELEKFRKKLSELKFLDPACGSGNFLTETYISLRRLENEALTEMYFGQMILGGEGELNPIRVGIGQFYGIEINDFAVTVAKTALWIAEAQMLAETEKIIHSNIEFLPLKSYANIVEGNALRIDWERIVPKSELSYIMGNPPFVGYAYQTSAQKEDLQFVEKNIGKNIDYVAGWYFKTAYYIKDSNIRAALVSTNSITQGEQVALIWKNLFSEYNIHIDFAHRTFRWDSEASQKAQVHCVIVGFSTIPSSEPKMIFTSGRVQNAENINGYLLDAPNIYIDRRTTPISNVPSIYRGSQPTDDGNFILTEEEKDSLLLANPQAVSFIRPYMMGKDFINRKPRYCIWLVGADPATLKKCPAILERVQKVKVFREKSKKAATREKANTPTLFDEIHDCKSDYIAIPKVSSENRRYIPIDYLNAEIIAGDKLFMMPNATLFHFGVLTSNVHMAWMRAVCGRLKSDYSYSNTIVYNNFPWPNPTEAQKSKIEKTAQMILDARALYPDSSLADLYDEITMPPELRRAHQENDRAVMDSYGFVKGHPARTSESACVAELMKIYADMTKS